MCIFFGNWEYQPSKKWLNVDYKNKHFNTENQQYEYSLALSLSDSEVAEKLPAPTLNSDHVVEILSYTLTSVSDDIIACLLSCHLTTAISIIISQYLNFT
jgi:hypothetical protein